MKYLYICYLLSYVSHCRTGFVNSACVVSPYVL